MNIDPIKTIAPADLARCLLRRCTRCGRPKPLGCFRRIRDRPQSWCRTCERIANAMWRETAEYRAWHAAYRARPDVAARARDCEERHRADRLRAKRAYRRTERGRLVQARCNARHRLRAATAPETVARLTRLVAALTAGIERIDRMMEDPS